MLYFAYGSKMNIKKMDKVCGNSNYKIIGVCKLLGFRFENNEHSKTWNGPAGDIVESKNDFVLGVLYEINNPCRPSLDKSEGYQKDRLRPKNTYEPIDITKFLNDCSERNGEEVFTYKHANIYKVGGLNCKYKQIIIDGARQHTLSEDYISNFLDIPCVDNKT